MKIQSCQFSIVLKRPQSCDSMPYPVTMGADRNRLTAASYGKEKPFAGGNDEAA
ncbi:MAG: hypothetical protein PHY09_00770 [Desulfuromonadaceae bacterium]|nr:hypothetical protein [Desulfuromonadaceae bacterium]